MRGGYGSQPSRSWHPGSVDSLPPELRELPGFFLEILQELGRYKAELGGMRNFVDYPQIRGKVTAEDLKASFTDFEYVFLQVVGFARLHQHVNEIVAKNNGKGHAFNPATQQLERLCGITMHGDRDGATGVLRSAGPSLLEAFQASKTAQGGARRFFKVAFDREADPCLEGRVSRLLEYLEKHGRASSPSEAPWEDVSLRPLPESATPTDIVGEHLRVFMGECTYRWANAKGFSYEQAKEAQSVPEHTADFERTFNAATFATALRSKGVVADPQRQVRWEACSRDYCAARWTPYDAAVSAAISAAKARGQPSLEVTLGPKRYRYEIDFRRQCQRNSRSGTEYQIRQSGSTWEAQIEAGREWTPYDEAVSTAIERAFQQNREVVQVRIGPKSWRYDIDLRRSVQRNPETGKERPVRRSESCGIPSGKVTPEQAKEAIKYFVDLVTLPEAPPSGRG